MVIFITILDLLFTHMSSHLEPNKNRGMAIIQRREQIVHNIGIMLHYCRCTIIRNDVISLSKIVIISHNKIIIEVKDEYKRVLSSHHV